MNRPDSNVSGPTIVIFGASGDLTRRQLIPALYNNFIKKRLPAGLRIVGFARRERRPVQGSAGKRRKGTRQGFRCRCLE